MSVVDAPSYRRPAPVPGTIGTSPTRPDGIAKVQGSFEFSSDLSADGCLWGATLRSPHPSARIRSIDVSGAWKIDGVETVITAADVPGKLTYGLISQDQPVFAEDVVRYVGEPIAAVAADDPETCRRALEAIVVDYEVLDAAARSRGGDRRQHDPIHPDGNLIRHQRIVRGDPTPPATSSSRAPTRSACRTRRSSASKRRSPSPTGRRRGRTARRHAVAARGPGQIAACLGLPVDAVRLVLGGVGGAFGAREDISLQVHTCLLALRLGRPVRMAYSRGESFLGHVHRHPATIWMRHHATADGEIVKIESRMVFDGGAYASTSSAVLINAVTHTRGRTAARTPSSTATRCAPTTCRAARCAGSAWCRRASPTSRRWTSWRWRAVSTRWRSGCATRCGPAIR
jgi:CO/xanthine dehydrogenase Mo-binding subunit